MNFSALELAHRRELAYRRELGYGNKDGGPIRVANFKKWTYTGSVSNSSALGYLAYAEDDQPCPPKAKSSVETPGLPSSPHQTPTLQKSPIKEEPYDPTEPPGLASRTPATKNRIGPSTPSVVYVGNINPTLRKNVIPPPRPDPTPRRTMMTRSQSGSKKPPLDTPQHPKPNPPQWPRVPVKARSGLKRKLPEIPTTPPSMKNPVDDELWCQLCKVICSGACNMQQHLRGRPHKAKMEWAAKHKGRNTNRGGSRGINYTCGACQIWCTDRFALGMHLKGKKHKAKLQEEVDKKRLVHCDACGIQCMNEESFQQHLKGRQHAMKQRDT